MRNIILNELRDFLYVVDVCPGLVGNLPGQGHDCCQIYHYIVRKYKVAIGDVILSRTFGTDCFNARNMFLN